MDRRTKFRQGLSSLYLPYYDALCDLLGAEWQPYCGIRTFDEQLALYRIGRETKGQIVTNAKSGESAHNYGCATDWCLWDGPVPEWPSKLDKLWLPYLHALDKVGLVPGSNWGDFPHNELSISCSWKHVLLCHTQGGMTAAQQKIEVAHAMQRP